MKRTGIANLPLHSGKAPRWLFERMVKLAGGLTDALVFEYGSEEFLRRISNPYWFQAFSCVLGFDWHSSGVTTTTCGALKMAVVPEKHGIAVAGGKGKTSRKAPCEIEEYARALSLSGEETEKLKYASKMSAKVDSACIQDGYQLYHHSFFFTESGWAVVQQGMNDGASKSALDSRTTPRYARRYHWLSSSVKSFVEEPHNGICCERKEKNVLDMTANESKDARKSSVDLVNDNPERLRKYFSTQRLLTEIDEFSLPQRHQVLKVDLTENSLNVLKKAYELQPENYEELVAIKGMGPKKIRALALMSDLLYGSKASWKDPVKYSFTHGGKDGFPYPVDRETYDSSILELNDALESAKIDNTEKYRAIKRLNEFISMP